jgi:hypothetical protein
LSLYDVKGGWGSKGAKLLLSQFHNSDVDSRSTWTSKGAQRGHIRHNSMINQRKHILQEENSTSLSADRKDEPDFSNMDPEMVYM